MGRIRDWREWWGENLLYVEEVERLEVNITISNDSIRSFLGDSKDWLNKYRRFFIVIKEILVFLTLLSLISSIWLRYVLSAVVLLIIILNLITVNVKPRASKPELGISACTGNCKAEP